MADLSTALDMVGVLVALANPATALGIVGVLVGRPSRGYESGPAGPGPWRVLWANKGHHYVVACGIGNGGEAPRPRLTTRSRPAQYRVSESVHMASQAEPSRFRLNPLASSSE
jgi:hypothetical protein